MAQLVVVDRHEVVCSNPGWSVTFFIAENIPVLSGRFDQIYLKETFYLELCVYVRYINISPISTKIALLRFVFHSNFHALSAATGMDKTAATKSMDRRKSDSVRYKKKSSTYSEKYQEDVYQENTRDKKGKATTQV